jgi:hypothetical protein
MGLLDAVSGGMNPLGAIAGPELLSVVSKGLDLLKGLLALMQEAQATRRI